MKKILLFSLIILTLISCEKKSDPTPSLNDEIVAEINLARTKPQEYANILKERLKYFDGMIYNNPDGRNIITKEGSSAVQEAINALNIQLPASSLNFNQYLSDACVYHVNDIGPKGLTQHEGSNGEKPIDRISRYCNCNRSAGENIDFGNKTAREIVSNLIIDDGVPSRGHRTNVYYAAYKEIGVAFGSHKVYTYMCVMDMATIATKLK